MKSVLNAFRRVFICLALLLLSGFRPAAPHGLAAQDESEFPGAPPKVWHLKLSINKVMESEMSNNPDPLASSRVTRSESFTPLSVELDLGPGFKMIPDSLKVNYSWRIDERQYFKKQLLFQCKGEESGSSLADYSFSFTRNFKPNRCEKILEVNDGETWAEQANDTFKVDFNAVIPGKNLNINYDNGEKIESEMMESLSDNFVLPYRFDRPVNANPNLNFSLGPPEAGIFKVFDYSLNYALTTSELSLQYVPLDKDLVGTDDYLTVGRLSHRKKGEAFLAKSYQPIDGEEKEVAYFIHGNSQIIVRVDGVDRSPFFSLVRLKREWETPNDAAPSYRGDEWRSDSDQKAPPNVWLDTPGQMPTGMDASRWASKRYLQEYLVAVHQHPEFGFLYYIVVVDTYPGRYQVRMFQAVNISAETWCRIKSSNKPYLTEADSKIAVDSGLKKPW